MFLKCIAYNKNTEKLDACSDCFVNIDSGIIIIRKCSDVSKKEIVGYIASSLSTMEAKIIIPFEEVEYSEIFINKEVDNVNKRFGKATGRSRASR